MINPPWRGILLLGVLTLLPAPSPGQDLARPFGWATLEGGTTGGAGGVTDTVDGAAAAGLAGILGGSEPRTVYLKGRYSGTLAIGSNKTLIGLPGSAAGSLAIAGSSNIILRNLDISRPSGDDGIRITESHHIWIDHCTVANGPDGNLDITRNSDFITVSFCIFEYDTPNREHRFSNLIASSDGDAGEYRITYAYNWWRKNVTQRMPRMRFTKCHIVNNLYTSEGNSKCVEVGHLSRPLVEGNVFIGVNTPILIRPEGTEALAEARNNIFLRTTGNTVASGKAFVPPYALSVRAPETVEEFVRMNAGPMKDMNVVANLVAPMPGAPSPRQEGIPFTRFPLPLLRVERSGKLEWVGVDGKIRPSYRLDWPDGMIPFR